MSPPAFSAPTVLRLHASPPRRLRPVCRAAPVLAASRPRAATLDAPVKTDLGALERMFSAPAAGEELGEKAKVDPGKKAKVMLLNDAANERSYVSRVLMSVCPELGPDLAWKIMMQAHKNGSAVVGIYPFEQAELIVEQLRNNGLGSELVEA